MKKSNVAERPRKSVPGLPAEKIVKAKAAKAEEKKPATSVKDWKQEEENEGESKSVRGTVGGKLLTIEQEVVGSNYSKSNWDDSAWLVPETGQRMTVSYYFPSAKAIIDYPRTHEEARIKTAAFKALKVPYIAVLEGEPLDINEARASLRAQGAEV